MKKALLSLVLLFTTIAWASAQTFNVISSDTVKVNGTDADLQLICKSKIVNTSNQAIELGIVRTQNVISTGWETTICLDFCYDASTDSITTNIDAGDTTIVSLYFWNYNTIGTGMAELIFYDVIDPSVTKNTIYLGDAFTTNIEETQKIELKFYPNPVQEVLNIQLPKFVQTGKIEIYNVIGKKLKSYDISKFGNRFQVPVEVFPKGTYILRYYDDEGKTFITKKFQKTN